MNQFLPRLMAALIALMAALSLGRSRLAHAERIKDLGAFEGLRANQLVGYGVVVGLAGTGDDSLDYATQGVKGVISRFGLTLPPGVNPSLKNAAAVMITAELPALQSPGSVSMSPSRRSARPSRCAAARWS